MKSAASHPPERSGTGLRAVDTHAAQWVTRRRAGLDAAGENQLAAWLAADPAHVEAFARLSAMAEALQRARHSGAGRAIAGQLEERARKRRTVRRTLASAGAMALIAGMALWWQGGRPSAVAPRVQPVAQSPDPIRRLPDGSVVELNAGAEVAETYDAAVRRVTLVRGEALFRVRKDAARPFIVQAGGVALRAVGTAFSVRLSGGSVDVLVTEGSVAVADAADGRTLLPTNSADGTVPALTAGRGVTIGAAVESARRPVRVAAVTPQEIDLRLAWRVSRLEFDGATLAEAVARVNRVNREQIAVADEATGRLRISGTFAADDPRTFARLAAVSLGLEVDGRDERQILLRKSPAPARRD
jgi:transmembrane sensor